MDQKFGISVQFYLIIRICVLSLEFQKKILKVERGVFELKEVLKSQKSAILTKNGQKRRFFFPKCKS
jgi:hypothetical protein